jgi:hypothetical protein
MNFNFNGSEIANVGASKGQLEGNKIHDVQFDGCEAVELKDGTMKVLRIKFSNDEGVFNHTIFEPRDGDDQDTDGMYGKNPSRIKEMMTLLRHLGAAVCPALVEYINSINGSVTWDQIRKKIVEVTTPAIGTKTKIKLLAKKRTDPNTGAERNDAVFPSYFLSYNREGALYMRTKFIGAHLVFTDKELTAIKNQENAKPVSVSSADTNIFGAAAVATQAEDPFNIDINEL